MAAVAYTNNNKYAENIGLKGSILLMFLIIADWAQMLGSGLDGIESYE